MGGTKTSLLQDKPFWIFEFSREIEPPHPWTLFFFDDRAFECAKIFGEHGDIESLDRVDELATTDLGSYDQLEEANVEAIWKIPYYVAAHLREVRRLVVSPFVVSAEDQKPIRDLLKESQQDSSIACLLDMAVAKEQLEKLPRDATKHVYDLVRNCGVATSQIAYLTTAGLARKEIPDNLERIFKTEVTESQGKRLYEWWQQTLGSINYDFFLWQTNKMGVGHKASQLRQALNDGKFPEFLAQQGKIEKYGVWRWVEERVQNSHSRHAHFEDAQIAYHCGKVFLRSGCSSHSCGARSRPTPFSYFALRGLVFGLFQGGSDDRFVPVAEDPPLVPFDVDDDNAMGIFVLDNECFEPFAQAFRQWIESFVRDPGPAKPNRAILRNDFPRQQNASLEVVFSSQLHPSIIDGTGIGIATRNYKSLKRFFNSDSAKQPKVSDDRYSITFTFRRDGGPFKRFEIG